ncbi:hypothetical protein NDU88_001796 [Pleurodeles waltl]|uniref:Uncharacterized protein n=1 Tax=Pleurodeles waltl TaxID=8319 RepID=A0AAV7VB30_PLEWA|nr:hypothetical protein NDU88_001796 [Pleurodeles waltl]
MLHQRHFCAQSCSFRGLRHSKAPGGVRNSIYWAFHPPLTPRARSATHQLHQLILLPRWLDPVSWILLSRTPSQHPGVSGRRSPGPPCSGTQLKRTTCPATISPVSTGVYTRARCPLFTPLLRCVSGPRAPPQVKRPRGLPPGHPVTSASLCSVTLSLTALLHPRSFLGPRPSPRIAPLRRPTERVFSWATGPQPASPPQQEDSSGVPRYSQAPEPPRPAAQREATTSIAGRPPYSPGAARLQGRRLATPDWAQPHLGSQAPSGTSAAVGGLAQSPPSLRAVRPHAASDRGPTQGRGFGRVLRPPAPNLSDGPTPALSGAATGAHPRSAPPHSLDLDRPGEGALPNALSPAPPERDIQACAISGSLATPPNACMGSPSHRQGYRLLL